MDKIRKLRLNLNEGHPLEEHLLRGREAIVFRVVSCKDDEDLYDFSKNEIVLGVFPDGRFTFLRITKKTRIVRASKFSEEGLEKLRKTLTDLADKDYVAIIRFRAMAIVKELIQKAD